MQYKSWKGRWKHRASYERSFKDEKFPVGWWWHVRRRKRTRICDVVNLFLPKLKPFHQSFLIALTTWLGNSLYI